MTMNENMLKGKWLEVKGDIQKAWGKLTDDDLEQTKGDLKSIGGLIMQRYGETQGDYSKKLADIFSKFEEKKDEAISKVKETLKN